MHNCCLRQLGRIDYASALQLQQKLAADRKQGLVPDHLLLLDPIHDVEDAGWPVAREDR